MRRAFLAGAAAILLATAPALAQQAPTPPAASPDSTARDSLRIRPGVAFMRSLIVPGWGQASAGAYTRGAFFFALQAATDFVLFKTLARLGDAEAAQNRQRAFYGRVLIDSLNAVGTPAATESAYQLNANPALLQQRLDSGYVHGATALVNSRKKQREDWITLAVFWTLASGADAFVNAQLTDFPAGFNAEARPQGGMLLYLSLPARKFW